MVNKLKDYEKYRQEYCVLRMSGLFDEEKYSNKYLKNKSENPILHFLTIGNKLNYKPNDDFDCKWYLDNNPDVKKEGINPFVHYVTKGRKEGRFPIPYQYESEYEEDFYIILNSGLFDKLWFVNNYSLKKNSDPIIYYLRKCIKLGLNPSPKFDTLAYLDANPDVKRDGMNPFVHYIKYGKTEGRLPKPCNFDRVIKNYISNNNKKILRKKSKRT